MINYQIAPKNPKNKKKQKNFKVINRPLSDTVDYKKVKYHYDQQRNQINEWLDQENEENLKQII